MDGTGCMTTFVARGGDADIYFVSSNFYQFRIEWMEKFELEKTHRSFCDTTWSDMSDVAFF